jgi:hypothetical protein
MKFVGLCILFSFAILSCSNGTEKVDKQKTSALDEFIRIPTNEKGEVDTSETAKITFDHDHFAYDTVQAGEVVKHSFTFTNTGKQSLMISNVKSSCGCTIADYPDAPISPGESGAILSTFDSKDKAGPQINEITVTANTYPQRTKVTLSGIVVPKDQETENK